MEVLGCRVPPPMVGKLRRHLMPRFAVVELEHIHEQEYRFPHLTAAIPLTQPVNAYVSEQRYQVSPRSALVLNPGQPHLPSAPAGCGSFLIVMIEARLFCDTARLCLGRELRPHAPLESRQPIHPLESGSLDLLHAFIRENSARQAGYHLQTEALSSQFIVTLIRSLFGAEPPQERFARYRENLRQAIEHLQAHLSEPYSLSAVAEAAQLSPFHFARLFAEHTGYPPHAYLQRLRIEKACTVLAESDLPVQTVAFSCGFPNPAHFATVFKKRIGLSPSAFRARSMHSPRES